MSNWDDSLGELKMEETPMVFLSSLLGSLDIEDDVKMQIAQPLLTGGDYEMEFLYSFTAHMTDLFADIREITEDAEEPIEFSVSELLERTLQLMGVNGI